MTVNRPAHLQKTLLRLGSRESPLALIQTRLVAGLLARQEPDLHVEIRTFKTRGDRFLDAPLSQVGGKGLFVKELEEALLADEIDLAVHSMKDMPGLLPPGLALMSIGEREDARDVLLSRDGCSFRDLPPGAVVGTSSLRREALLRRMRPDLNFATLRGNLQTRYRRLTEGHFDAIVLAAAGVNRLGWQEKISCFLEPWTECVPAAGQGILAVEYRQDDMQTRELLAPLSLPPVETAQRAERTVLGVLEGGCQLPLGVHCRPTSHPTAVTDPQGSPTDAPLRENSLTEEFLTEDSLTENSLAEGFYEIKGIVLSPDGQTVIEETLRLDDGHAAEAGRILGERLLAKGARDILKTLSRTSPPVSPP